MTPSTVVADLARSVKRCAWSGAAGADLEQVEVETVDRWGRPRGPRAFWVQPQHRAALVAHGRFAARYARWFLPAVVVSLALMVLATQLAGTPGLALGLALFGTLLVALPFATPETVWMLGVRKSVLLARGIGVVMALVGVILAVGARR